MKSLIISLISLIFLSCSSFSVKNQIVNTVIHEQLALKKYSHLKTLDIYLVETADNGYEALATYEYSYRYSSRLIDSIWPHYPMQIKKLEKKLKNRRHTTWTNSDFKNLKYSLITWDTVISNIRKERYLNNPNTLVIRISRPLFIDSNNALVSFHSGATEMGFNTVDRFTLLMTKKGKEWVRTAYYNSWIYE